MRPTRPATLTTLTMLAALASLAGLPGCGDGSAPAADATASKGQVRPATSQAKVSFYAASRFAEQATFGPTPTLVAELQSKGFEAWIDEQFALPPTTIDSQPARINGNPIPRAPYDYQGVQAAKLMLTAPDQLRTRVAWSIGQWIVVSGTKPHPVGTIEWINSLQRWAFGTYGELLYNVSIHPTMGQFLDNIQNRPKSAECPSCAPNENYARELMQLFSIGVLKLNADGTPVKNSRGGFIETYAQKDVEELARVLTGWTYFADPFGGDNFSTHYYHPMIPTTWPPQRDSGQKTVLGRVFPAGQSQEKDLRDAVELLSRHANAAPFVALRLIQHLVKSNPTPAYVGRVAAVYRNNGQGVVGDMRALVKAVLLDAEARAGDGPGQGRSDDGKIREPVLWRTAVARSMGCTLLPYTDSTDQQTSIPAQPPWWPESVFSFYAPTDRAPGSNLLAPEQGLLVATELTRRLSELNWRTQGGGITIDQAYFSRKGCSLEALVKAFGDSPRAFSDLLAQQYFRGAMPPTLRVNLEQLIVASPELAASPDYGALRMLQFALSTPYFGVIQ